jgi:uncharacterized protein (UPF0261 family)
MSIEFGILRDGSTITLLGKHRVIVDEDLFVKLTPVFAKIEARTGQELDMYGSAVFENESLSAFIEEIRAAKSTGVNELLATLDDILRVANFACANEKQLSYFGE